ncbi:MAG TPA: cysteine synthase family protein [Candidatus Caldiarchaeum subterraneum]|uniref:Cysteine synthase family protein n=1 Tax=Caldiarchaeum subterraneum TaxID=311458 RepID=A0A833EAS4_CALS0|nr:cysteine synthase family protein [Aigarchaeota archaeon]HIQ29955.1 cysteine synthase family protein [Candidatus Caldarchaeum subterraneum]
MNKKEADGLLTLATSGRGVAELIGKTPMVRLRSFETKTGVKLFAKLEMTNPGGSVKDRAALYIMRDAERRGLLTRGKTLIDATSGNTGIAYSMLGASLGYRVKLFIPSNASKRKITTMKAFGAELVLTDPMEGIDGAIKRVRKLHESSPREYFYADQYSNPANPRAHYETTGPEIIQQTGGRVTHLVAGVGTSGTLIGLSRRLKEHSSRVRVVEVQPDSEFHGIEGLKHMASALRPGIYNPDAADMHLTVTTEEAEEVTHKLAAREGILAGTSSGAALAAALKVYEEIREGFIVVILPDGDFPFK